MADEYEYARIKGEGLAPDLLIWRRYKVPAPGVLARFLAANPQVHAALAVGPFLPVGALVRIPIDRDILNSTPATQKQIKLYGEA